MKIRRGEGRRMGMEILQQSVEGGRVARELEGWSDSAVSEKGNGG